MFLFDVATLWCNYNTQRTADSFLRTVWNIPRAQFPQQNEASNICEESLLFAPNNNAPSASSSTFWYGLMQREYFEVNIYLRFSKAHRFFASALYTHVNCKKHLISCL